MIKVQENDEPKKKSDGGSKPIFAVQPTHTHTRRRTQTQTVLLTIDGDNVEVLGTGVVGAVHDGLCGQGKGHAELVALVGSSTALGHGCFCVGCVGGRGSEGSE